MKKGHWIISYIDQFTLSPESPNYLLTRQSNGVLYIPEYRCSCCEQTMSSYPRGYKPNMPQDADFPNFCPNCGADMRKSSD